jgi:hypothetical protein
MGLKSNPHQRWGVADFQNAKPNQETYTSANRFLLELLKAYDKTNGKRTDLLRAAYDFACWIKESKDEELDWTLKTLNYYQVIKRMREFDISEITEIWKIADDYSLPINCRVAAYLLLDQHDMAAHNFERMSATSKKEFETFPIYHFWKDTLQ